MIDVVQVLILLIQQWLKYSRPLAQASPRLLARSRSLSTSVSLADEELVNRRPSYQVLNSLSRLIVFFSASDGPISDFLRIVRQGPAVKNAVDEAIDRCAIVLNLRDSIEEERVKAEQATDENRKRVHTAKGLPKN